MVTRPEIQPQKRGPNLESHRLSINVGKPAAGLDLPARVLLVLILPAALLRNWTELKRFFWSSNDTAVAVCYAVIAGTEHAVATFQNDPQDISTAHNDEVGEDGCFVV